MLHTAGKQGRAATQQRDQVRRRLAKPTTGCTGHMHVSCIRLGLRAQWLPPNDRLSAVAADASPGGAHRRGDGAGAQQVARQQVAAADRVVRHHLRQRPVPAARANRARPRRMFNMLNGWSQTQMALWKVHMHRRRHVLKAVLALEKAAAAAAAAGAKRTGVSDSSVSRRSPHRSRAAARTLSARCCSCACHSPAERAAGRLSDSQSWTWLLHMYFVFPLYVEDHNWQVGYRTASSGGISGVAWVCSQRLFNPTALGCIRILISAERSPEGKAAPQALEPALCTCCRSTWLLQTAATHEAGVAMQCGQPLQAQVKRP